MRKDPRWQQERKRLGVADGRSASVRESGLTVPIGAAVQQRMNRSLEMAIAVMWNQPREIIQVAAMAFFMGCVKAAPSRTGEVSGAS